MQNVLRSLRSEKKEKEFPALLADDKKTSCMMSQSTFGVNQC